MGVGEVPPTKVFLNLSLAETVFGLWQHDARFFERLEAHADHLRRLFTEDRAQARRPALREHFVVVLGRDLRHCNLPIPTQLPELGAWIYKDPRRCPAKRLGFEVYHRLLRNIEDIPANGDLADFFHIECVPYVDLITLDSRMRNYVRQAYRATGAAFDGRVCANVGEITARI